MADDLISREALKKMLVGVPIAPIFRADDTVIYRKGVFAEDIDELPSVQPKPKTDVLDKIKDYIDHIKNTGMGKKKSLEFLDKFIDGLKSESEDK